MNKIVKTVLYAAILSLPIIPLFLHFFPELIKKGHVYLLQTPLFRVRN